MKTFPITGKVVGSLIVAGAFTLTCLPGAGAQCRQADRGGSYGFSFGNSNAGAMGSFEAHGNLRSAECTGGALADVGASGYVDVRLFGLTYRALDARASASVQGSSTSAESHGNLYFRIGPYTLVSMSDPHYISWSRSHSITLVRASHNLMVGPVPITLTASVGVGMNADLELRPNYPVELEGSLVGWARGTGAAYVNGGVLRAGVQTILDLLKTTLSANAQIRTTGASGLVQLIFEPVRIRIRGVAERKSCRVSNWRLRCSWKEIAGITLVDYSRGSFTRTLFTF